MKPNFLQLSTIDEYKEFYENSYCKKPTITFDGIPIYFAKDRFFHAFYESSDKRGSKDIFSKTRAKRMSWIRPILESNSATILQGWDKRTKSYKPCVRVAFEWEEFVIIVRLSLKRNGNVKGNFITCYLADNSIEKIKKAPNWSLEDCLKYFGR